MFKDYKTVFWLAVIMTICYYVPFYVGGWSTDVWMRFYRIKEWADLGFPWRENLMMGQNFPYGHEMHWTRPLDIIGYIFAWPFIPNWGIKKALEMMSFYVPLLTLCTGVGGFFYALRGYVTPKMAFISFWLFFWGIGYIWGQSTVGYFDHHVFHFTILMWVAAFIARSFLREHNKNLLIAAGILTAIGTWITAEFFINSYIVLVPFIFYWLFYDKSLKPALIYCTAYTVFLIAVLSFDHPMAGFGTLDFYRVSLFHVILGAMNCVLLAVLILGFNVIHSSGLRRFIYLILGGVIYLCVLIGGFCDVLMVPMVDFRLSYIWTSKVSEMQPTYNTPAVLPFGILPLLLAIVSFVIAVKERLHKYAPMVMFCSVGLIFYVLIFFFHIRVGISSNVFFVLLATLFFNAVFFPREHSRFKTFVFVLFYGLMMLGILKGTALVERMQEWGTMAYQADFEKDENAPMPAFLRERLKKAAEADKNNDKRPSVNTNDPWIKTCDPSQKAMDFIKTDSQQGAVFTDIFDAPQILWETNKPILAGPYHTNIKGVMDMFYMTFDRPPFERAHKIIKNRHITQVYIKNPQCLAYLFVDEDKMVLRHDLDHTFYYSLYHKKKVPGWLKLAFENPATGEKIYHVVKGASKASDKAVPLKKAKPNKVVLTRKKSSG